MYNDFKRIFYLLLFFSLYNSCVENETIQEVSWGSASQICSDIYFNSLNTKAYKISNVEIAGDCLNISVIFLGCD